MTIQLSRDESEKNSGFSATENILIIEYCAFLPLFSLLSPPYLSLPLLLLLETYGLMTYQVRAQVN